MAGGNHQDNYATQQKRHTFKYAERITPICLRVCGVLHPGVNRGWGDPAHFRTPIPVSVMEA